MPRLTKPVLLVMAVFSRHEDALQWAKDQLQTSYGAIVRESDVFSFHHTSYYHETMGGELVKQLFYFKDLVGEDCLPDVKRYTIQLENGLADGARYPEPRPMNIDPGILTLGKFLLATTKDQAHRIYLRDGIYAEVTLRYQDKAFHSWPWTYADYREPAYHEFLVQARRYYRKRLAELASEQEDK